MQKEEFLKLQKEKSTLLRRYSYIDGYINGIRLSLGNSEQVVYEYLDSSTKKLENTRERLQEIGYKIRGKKYEEI